jgi:hypothetical protein
VSSNARIAREVEKLHAEADTLTIAAGMAQLPQLVTVDDDGIILDSPYRTEALKPWIGRHVSELKKVYGTADVAVLRGVNPLQIIVDVDAHQALGPEPS